VFLSLFVWRLEPRRKACSRTLILSRGEMHAARRLSHTIENNINSVYVDKNRL